MRLTEVANEDPRVKASVALKAPPRGDTGKKVPVGTIFEQPDGVYIQTQSHQWYWIPADTRVPIQTGGDRSLKLDKLYWGDSK